MHIPDKRMSIMEASVHVQTYSKVGKINGVVLFSMALFVLLPPSVPQLISLYGAVCHVAA